MLSTREAGLKVIDMFAERGGTFKASDFVEEVSKILPKHEPTGFATALSKHMVRLGAAVRVKRGYYRPIKKENRVPQLDDKGKVLKKSEIKDMETLILNTPFSKAEIGDCYVSYAVKLSERIKELEEMNKALRTELCDKVATKEETIKHLNVDIKRLNLKVKSLENKLSHYGDNGNGLGGKFKLQEQARFTHQGVSQRDAKNL